MPESSAKTDVESSYDCKKEAEAKATALLNTPQPSELVEEILLECRETIGAVDPRTAPIKLAIATVTPQPSERLKEILKEYEQQIGAFSAIKHDSFEYTTPVRPEHFESKCSKCSGRCQNF